MVREVLETMGPVSGGVFCDCTVGTAGHGAAILEASGPDGFLVGLDRDEQALDLARSRLSRFDGSRWKLVHGAFDRLDELLDAAGVQGCDGILADLGLSTLQLDDPERGFSFRFDGPLDMRMDTSSPRTALDVIRGSSRTQLEHIIREYGEERMAGRVARVVHEGVRASRIRDTAQLAEAIRQVLRRRRSGGVDAATRTFQAIRIAVNDEMDQLSALLGAFCRRLKPGGVFVCLAYHSLEDRMVKNALRDLARAGEGTLITRKPMTPGEEEVRANGRARSARLRAFRRAGGEG